MDYERIRLRATRRRRADHAEPARAPERLDAAHGVEQADAIERANADRDVGAIVMTGAGRGFCAGADMQDDLPDAHRRRDPGDDTAGGEGGMPARLDWVALCARSKPLVAAVNGAAVGVGMTMILPFDVIVASEQARFGMFFIKMGLVPELASTHFLVQRIGFGRASEMCLSGRLYAGAGGVRDAGSSTASCAPDDAARHGARARRARSARIRRRSCA